jgi:hypothetical protein
VTIRYRINEAPECPGGRSITCLVCGNTSCNPNDVDQLWCGNCSRFLRDPGDKDSVYESSDKVDAAMRRAVDDDGPWHRELFDSIRIGELWFACDTALDLEHLKRAAVILEGIPLRNRRCYTMIGYDGETLADAERRIEKVLELGFMPFAQLYQPPTAKTPTKVYGADWKAVMKKWCRPAAYMSADKNGQKRTRENREQCELQ